MFARVGGLYPGALANAFTPARFGFVNAVGRIVAVFTPYGVAAY